jgi:hypothetical protein
MSLEEMRQSRVLTSRRALPSGRFGRARDIPTIYGIFLYECSRSRSATLSLESKHPKIGMESPHSPPLLNQIHPMMDQSTLRSP